MTNHALIEFRDVTKRFGDRTILNRINLIIYDREVTTLIGKSGTGKSVLLKHIIGLLRPDEGSILFRGKPIDKMAKAEWNEYLGQISYMFQNNALFDSLTVFENVAMPIRQTTKWSKREIDEKVMGRIEQTELTEVVDKYPSELSGGMKKRVALSRALVTDPKIVLFDEPTTGQDLIRRNAIMSMIARYQKQLEFTAILISHDLPDVFFISNRILALDEGEIIFQGTPEEFDEFQHPFIDEFVTSLEGFQENLTGLYSNRSFKVRYQKQIGQKHPHDIFALVTFSVEDLDLVDTTLGHETSQQVISAMGTYVNKHFGSVGGFSTRESREQFITVLPFSDLNEAQKILEDFATDLEKQGLWRIQAAAQIPKGDCFAFSVSAGLAQGMRDEEIGSVLGRAKSQRKIIARFQCPNVEVEENAKVRP
jgi:phospholipid/cholesterol/gamma-HCH transport system ATP-binding protein